MRAPSPRPAFEASVRLGGIRPGVAGLALTLGGLPALLCPAPLAAHLVTTGLGPYYDGAGHLLVTPQDLLPLIGLALLAGIGGTATARTVVFGVPAAWLAGGLAGLGRPDEVAAPILTALTVLVVGGLLAADRDPPARVVGALALAVAVVHGFLNGTAMSAAGYGARALLGISAAAFVLLALSGAAAVALRQGWTRIALRVAGSWIVATGLFMVGWALR